VDDRCILIVGDEEDIRRARALEVGADDDFPKPFSPLGHLERIAKTRRR